MRRTIAGPSQFHDIRIWLSLSYLRPIVLDGLNESHLGAAVRTKTRELAL